MATVAPWEIRALLTAEIAGLTASTDYDKSDPTLAPPLAGVAWREAERPLIPERDPAPADLAFFVDDRALSNPDLVAEGEEGLIYCQAPVVVRFTYQTRPGVEIADWDRSFQAAWHLCSALSMARSYADRLNVWPQPGLFIERRPLRDKSWLAVEVSLMVQFSTYLNPE